MSNAKVNTEEVIVRSPTDTPANADANSLRIYTDGSSLYYKDSTGTVTNITSSSFDPVADTVVLGNETGAGPNSIHLKASGGGTDQIIVGSGTSGSPDTEGILIHSSVTTDIESAGTVNVSAPNLNIGVGTSSSDTVNILSNAGNGNDTVNILSDGGTGNDTVNILTNGSDGQDTLNVGSVASAVDAFNVYASNIKFSGLPTSSSGLTSGDLWNDSGTLRIVT